MSEQQEVFQGSVWEIWIDDLCGEIAMDKNDLARKKIEVVEMSDYTALREKYEALTQKYSERADKYGDLVDINFELQDKLQSKETEIARLHKFLDKYNLIEVIEEWQGFWMNQKQNNEADYQNYFHRAFGVDANMKHHLASVIRDKALRGAEVKGES